MRNIFQVSASLLMASHVLAQDRPPLQALNTAIEITPRRIAAIGPDLRRTTPWFDVTGPFKCDDPLCFDAFDPDSAGFPTGGDQCHEDLELPSSRWFFGTSFCNMFSTSDLECHDDNVAADTIGTAFYWTCAGQTTQSCFVAIQMWDDFDETCDGPDRGAFLEGVILQFGALECNPGGYYFTNVCLGDFGLRLTTPEGLGAYDIILGQAYDSSSGIITLADCAQPMLWGTDHRLDEFDGPGTHGPIQWDDDNPIDGTHTPIDECYDYTFGLCPEPLTAMFALYSKPRGGCITLGVPTLVAGSPATFSGVGLPNQQVTVAYAFASQPGFTGTLGNYCADSQLSPPLGAGFVFTTTTDALGNYSKTVNVPAQSRGVTVQFQAFGAGTCPLPCDSALHSRTVL